MALPPKDMHLACLRCKAAMGEEDDICLSCGADRRVEMAVAAELDPEIGALRRWLMILGALAIGIGLLNWEHLGDSADGKMLQALVVPPIGLGVFMFVLSAFARRAPFVVPLLALIVFGLALVAEAVITRSLPVGTDFGTALKVMFILVLVGAMQAGYKARRIREIADEQVAKARVVKGA